MKYIFIVLLLFSNLTFAITSGSWVGGPLGCPVPDGSGLNHSITFEVITEEIPEDAVITDVYVSINMEDPLPETWLGAYQTPLIQILFYETWIEEYFDGMDALTTYFTLWMVPDGNETLASGTCIIIVNWKSNTNNVVNTAIIPLLLL